MGQFNALDFILVQWRSVPPALYGDVTGKTIMVIGANTGIGFEAAKHFAHMGPKKLILGCRNEKKGQDAVEEIEKETKYRAELALVDLSNFSSAVAFARRFANEPLDILCLNAGIAVAEYKSTKDGWERSIQVNHLSIALLAILLTPALVRTAKLNNTHSRLVITASGTHYWTNFGDKYADAYTQRGILETLNDKELCTATNTMETRYWDSKLLNVLFTRALADRLPTATPLVPTAIDPGLCRSELTRSLPLKQQILFFFVNGLLARSSEQGSRPLLWGALGPDGKEGDHVKALKGAFVMNAATVDPSDFAMSKEGKEARDRLWNETIEVLSTHAPEVREVVAQYYVPGF